MDVATTPIGLVRPNTLARISTACLVPAQITMDSGDVRTPRTRPRYSASASRNSMRPRGSPIRRASVGAAANARLVEADQASRGNAATSGDPGMKSCVGTPGVPLGLVGSAEAAVDHPGARALAGRQPPLGHQFGVGLGDGVAGQSQVGGEVPGRRQHRPRHQATGPDGVAQGGDEQVPRAPGARGEHATQVQVQVPGPRIGP